MVLSNGRKLFQIVLAVVIQYLRVTDTHTASQPARHVAVARTVLCYRVAQVTRNSAVVDKPARRVYRSVKITKHSTIPYVRYSFLLCNCNFVFKTRRFYDIPLQKCRDIEIRVRGHSGHRKCYHLIDRVWFPISVL